MPLPIVTAADLKARYPVFTSQSDILVGLMLDEAKGAVAETWIEADQKPALLAYAAHLLALETTNSAVATGANGQPIAVTGPLERIEVGDVKVQYAHQFRGEGGGSGSSSNAALSATPYGRRYLELLRRSIPGVLVV